MVILDKLLASMKPMARVIFSQMSCVLDILEDYCFFRTYKWVDLTSLVSPVLILSAQSTAVSTAALLTMTAFPPSMSTTNLGARSSSSCSKRAPGASVLIWRLQISSSFTIVTGDIKILMRYPDTDYCYPVWIPKPICKPWTALIVLGRRSKCTSSTSSRKTALRSACSTALPRNCGWISWLSSRVGSSSQKVHRSLCPDYGRRLFVVNLLAANKDELLEMITAGAKKLSTQVRSMFHFLCVLCFADFNVVWWLTMTLMQLSNVTRSVLVEQPVWKLELGWS
jgi:hypothetical protein